MSLCSSFQEHIYEQREGVLGRPMTVSVSACVLTGKHVIYVRLHRWGRQMVIRLFLFFCAPVIQFPHKHGLN